jgi:ubiquinone/menaquinone biosynthesis C-methylase UbiE
MSSYTRGKGLLEGFLAKKRASKANSLIRDSYRKGRILDIGCGSYPYFLESTNFKEKYGIDPSLNILKFKNKNIFLKKIDITKQKLSFTDNYFDVVTMLAVFEHIDGEKLDSALREIKRVLKKDGIFIITTPAPWADGVLHLMSKLNLISEDEIHEHKHNHRNSKIVDILKKSGFKKEKIKSGYFEIYMNMWFTSIK